ncbi:hypothetical protein FC816_00635 [Clostridium botulinum]|uniref:Uncharacterized protein n=1 Tax=Clostridium botulinum TaxID=1491 RepID=A0A6B4G725_CLOBO|nr:hypothetical protein [Clostridium botulinum]MBN3382932.1 hypothetical protein [Clostridium botulinum]NFF90077.1 hypothetical protein [Clostridium botulinum]NFG16863.1 hypothetical protein [Clostridium botulinum]NFG30628.1 hypothetical protein [Clostridium botulinum]NFG33771.1 hypothetical protein [Clostridium botulinum]
MTQAERIIKNYDVAFIKSGFLGIRKKGDTKFIAVAPSKTVNLYFLFGGKMENFEELKKEKKAFKITGYGLYKKMFGETKFQEFLAVWHNYKIKRMGA